MDITYFEAVMAFFGIASIAIGSLADYLAGYVLREEHSPVKDFNISRAHWTTSSGMLYQTRYGKGEEERHV
ncbi:hypothetical protein FFI89_011840 [Bradyrhizobium sp. KBS0727]|jgi:hypothetical protein|uniref:hypothetical protein n=1 Tax=unclassified Bradyrhizobium TaxID=2631580 RepID=UPI00110E1CCF|nr:MULTISPECIES: hypothetical protein [unclassified Bradyrhizobium]QDW37785.1 hypothetical protein FFI71_011835 [Bradyrhizobium sp. KBS0725]QDW44389.1 hypothetical protein FFI89_011840 [Bradyrhizobium sp. KBS0727]